jgi:hypothetical protein
MPWPSVKAVMSSFRVERSSSFMVYQWSSNTVEERNQIDERWRTEVFSFADSITLVT